MTDKPELEARIQELLAEIKQLKAELDFWKERAAIEGEATVNAAEAAERFRAQLEMQQAQVREAREPFDYFDTRLSAPP